MSEAALGEDTHSNKGGAEHYFRLFLRIGLPVLAILATLYSCVLLLTLPATHEDLHFAHAAWLMQQGKSPFDGFLFHNSPAILYLLRINALWDPDFGPEVLFWARSLVVVALLTSAYWIYRIGARLATPTVGWLAIFLFVPTTTVVYARAQLLLINFQFRPEVYGYPLMLMSFYYALALLEKPGPKHPFRTALLASVPVGLAMFLTPRFIYYILGVLLVLAWNWRAVPWRAWVGVGSGAAVPVVLYLAFVGYSDTYFWVYEYPKEVYRAAEFEVDTAPGQVGADLPQPIIRSRFYWLRRNPAMPLIVLAVPVGLWFLATGRNKKLKATCFVTLLLFLNVLLETGLNSASWKIHGVFGALLVAVAIRWLWRKHSYPAMATAVAIAFVCVVFPNQRAVKSLNLFSDQAFQLSGQVDAYQRVCAALDGDTIYHIQKLHPIACYDASWYWTQRSGVNYMVEALPAMEEYVEPAIGQVIESRPAILAPDEMRFLARTQEERDTIETFIAENYRETPKGYYLRNDRYEDLQPLLDSREVEMHMFPVPKK